MFLYLRLLSESFKFATNALRSNKLRTFLSLLGVTIGIFSIIAVLAAVDSLDHKIKNDLSNLDKNTIYLMKYSFGPSDIPDWKIQQFPNVTYDEFEFVRKNLRGIDKASFNMFVPSQNVKSDFGSASGVSISPCTNEYEDLDVLNIETGRFFNESESNSGAPVVVLGKTVAETLFPGVDPLGKYIRAYGKRLQVIGVLEKAGSINVGGSTDMKAILPVNFIRQIYGDNNKGATPAIIVKPVKEYDINLFQDELTQKLRTYRGLKPSDDNNFFVNVFSGFTDLIDNIVAQLNFMGWILSGFSLLVGGFGIANIMYVSVKERTNLIGIQKSLGAKSRFILYQFLFEAVILSLFGGLVGLLLVWLIAIAASSALDFEFILSLKNIIIGSSLAAVIGLISGILPAISASKLDPVEAIRSGM
ncbi:ABC transporter permease [Flavobacterium agricola]|uniref:ABC transporter permease n=1 Tax=Flavobacterium agricola TaxID=2870839 RepID=A0ABY6M2H8_9FLAO|nr:ABC transporter permease [Flavobacterium agricola]UYW01341.1 ABC transporter permease [Flavobacterium agricola]